MGFQIQAGKVLLVGSATLSWIRVYTARGWSPGDRLGSIPLKGPTLSAPMVESPTSPGAKEPLNQSGYVPYRYCRGGGREGRDRLEGALGSPSVTVKMGMGHFSRCVGKELWGKHAWGDLVLLPILPIREFRGTSPGVKVIVSFLGPSPWY